MSLLFALAALASEPPAVVAGASAPAFSIAEGKGTATLLLNPATGSPKAALDALAFDAGAVVPAHRNEGSDELLYVISGRIELTVAGRTSIAHPGDAVVISAGAEHSARAIEAAKLVQVYVGPGPEERFRAAPPVARP